jgi:drug/metabolite transporter (DMT)-like permease
MAPGLVGTLAQPGIGQAPNILPIHCLSKWYRIVLYGIGCRSGHWHHGRLTPRRDRTRREHAAKKLGTMLERGEFYDLSKCVQRRDGMWRPDKASPSTGPTLMVIGCSLIVLNDALMKLVIVEIPVAQAIFVRSAVAMLPILLLARRYGGMQALRWRSFSGQFMTGGFAVGALVCLIIGLRHLPFAEAVILVHASPLFVVVLAPFLLREQVGWRRRSAVVAGFLGVVFIAQPAGGQMSWYLLLPLAAALFSAIRDIMLRRLVASETSVSILMFSNAMAFVCTLPFAVYTWSPMNGEHLWMLVTTGLFFGVGIFFMIDAYRFADASLVSGFRYSGILWALLLGIVIWGDAPGTVELLGVALIVGSGIFVLRRNPQRE